MDTKQKNYFNNPVVVIIVLILVGIVGYLLLSKNSSTTQNQISNTPLAQENLRQLQDNCNGWGKTIEANNKFIPQHQVFTHYNTVLGKCFVEVTEENYLGIDQYINSDKVFDAEKGVEIFLKMDTASGPGTFASSGSDMRPVNGSYNNITITSEQFVKFRDQYMNE